MARAFTKDKYTGLNILNPSLKLIGAKTKQRPELYQYFPTYYNSFVDVFLGTGGVLVGNKPTGLDYGFDINHDVINYYKVLQDSPERFWIKLQTELTCLYQNGMDDVDRGRILFRYWKDEIDSLHLVKDSEVQRAVYFYLITKHALNGIWRRNKSGKVNSSYCKTIRGRGIFDRKWFDLVVERVKYVNFRQGDFTAEYGPFSSGRGAFLFVDPPYRYKTIENGKGCVTTYNGEKFTDAQHQELANKLRESKSQWLLTINDDDWIRELYKDFDVVDRSVFYSCSQTSDGRGKRPELLIANYPISHIELKTEEKLARTRNLKANNKILEQGSDQWNTDGEEEV